jgi:hypothetical protein
MLPTPHAAIDTVIVRGPTGVVRTAERTAVVTFEFVSTVSGARFRCRLDGADWAPCASAYKLRVRPGRHTFAVRAGNDPTPARATFTVVRKKDR